jgi:hypothetical protein
VVAPRTTVQTACSQPECVTHSVRRHATNGHSLGACGRPVAVMSDLIPPDSAKGGTPHLHRWFHHTQFVALSVSPFVLPRYNGAMEQGANITAKSCIRSEAALAAISAASLPGRPVWAGTQHNGLPAFWNCDSWIGISFTNLQGPYGVCAHEINTAEAGAG